MLSAKNLRVDSRLDVEALELISGEITLVLGPNGAGKSTLLSVLAGLLPVAGAELRLKGKSLCAIEPQARAARLAVLTQGQQLDFAFSVKEVVLMGCYPLSLTESEKEWRLAQLVKQLELELLLDRTYITLSRGEAQRVQVARVLMQRAVEPGVILMDEPLTALDMKQKLQVMRLLYQLKLEEHALFLIVHDLNLAAEFGDQFLLLKNGKLFASGARDEVLTVDKLTELYETPIEMISREGEVPQFKAAGNTP